MRLLVGTVTFSASSIRICIWITASDDTPWSKKSSSSGIPASNSSRRQTSLMVAAICSFLSNVVTPLVKLPENLRSIDFPVLIDRQRAIEDELTGNHVIWDLARKATTY
jgi:hypothetical protein